MLDVQVSRYFNSFIYIYLTIFVDNRVWIIFAGNEFLPLREWKWRIELIWTIVLNGSQLDRITHRMVYEYNGNK